MTAQARDILEQALKLPERDRQRLAEALLDSVPPEVAKDIENAWNAEALRRAEAIERDEANTVDGDEALSKLRS